MTSRPIAKVVLPLSLDKEFDYQVPRGMGLERGMRVVVDFRGRKLLGLVMSLSRYSALPHIKPVLQRLDETAVFDEGQLSFAQHLSKHYPYPAADFLFMMLPRSLKKNTLYRSEPVRFQERCPAGVLEPARKPARIFVKAENFFDRYQQWKELVRAALAQGSVLICLPQIASLTYTQEFLQKDFGRQVFLFHSSMGDGEVFKAWRDSRANALILGTRLSVFYYPQDLGLLVIEEENSPYYFQEEKPYHHLFDVARLLCDLKRIDCVAGADFPSLHTYKRIHEGAFSLKDSAESTDRIAVVGLEESSRKRLIGPVATELLRKTTQQNRCVFIYWNKKGFSRVVSCSQCGHIVQCKRCSAYLQQAQAPDTGVCPYCHGLVPLPKLCGHCSTGYLKPVGFGIERIGLLLRRIFPEIKITHWPHAAEQAGFVLATAKILGSPSKSHRFDAGFILDTATHGLRGYLQCLYRFAETLPLLPGALLCNYPQQEILSV